MATDKFFTAEGELSAAELAHADGRYGQAEAHLRRLLTQTRAADYEWDDWLRRLAEVYRLTGRRRDAGVLFLYLHYHDLARETLPKEAHAERARSFALEKRWDEAAADYESAQLPVHAAVAYEEARDFPRARAAWAKLAADPRLRDHPYERALLHVNLGSAIGRAGGAREEMTTHFVAAQRLLEQVADDYETAGERERAYDCYQILIKLGQESAAFENLAEGYLNCIRILAADGLKVYVLQHYEDFTRQALERQELHAAATLFREAAEYAARTALPYSRHYLRRAGETWAKEAERAERAGAATRLVENALLASADCYAQAGDFPRVREAWQRLAKLDLGERSHTRYAALAERWAKAHEPEASLGDPNDQELPHFLRQARPYGDLWFVDLLEWENAGDPERVALAIIGDLRYPDAVRRAAVNLSLDAAAARYGVPPRSPQALITIAQSLGQLRSYAALAPLDRLYQEGDARVRRAAVKALCNLFFKRSFSLLQRGLADADSGVRDAAIEALGRLRFPHAFQPLARILREHSEDKVRTVALESLGKIGTVEAGELLISVLRQETGGLATVARRALAQFSDAEIVPILRQQLELEPNPELRRTFEDVIGRLRRRT